MNNQTMTSCLLCPKSVATEIPDDSKCLHPRPCANSITSTAEYQGADTTERIQHKVFDRSTLSAKTTELVNACLYFLAKTGGCKVPVYSVYHSTVPVETTFYSSILSIRGSHRTSKFVQMFFVDYSDYKWSFHFSDKSLMNKSTAIFYWSAAFGVPK